MLEIEHSCYRHPDIGIEHESKTKQTEYVSNKPLIVPRNLSVPLMDPSVFRCITNLVKRDTMMFVIVMKLYHNLNSNIFLSDCYRKKEIVREYLDTEYKDFGFGVIQKFTYKSEVKMAQGK